MSLYNLFLGKSYLLSLFKDEGGWGVSTHPHYLGSACQEVKDPLAQRGFKCWPVVIEQQSHISPSPVQMGEGGMEDVCYGIFIGWDSGQTVVGPVCWAARSRCSPWPAAQSTSSPQRWVPQTAVSQAGWSWFLVHRNDGGLLEARRYDRLSQGGLNIIVNTGATWSAHSLRTRPLSPSGPAVFRALQMSCSERLWVWKVPPSIQQPVLHGF